MIQPVLILNQKDPVIVTGGLVPRGAYAAGTDYAVGDSVDYLGSSYVMFVDAAAGTLPTDTTKWQVLANKGEPNTVTDTNSINMTLTGGTDIKADLVIQDTATVDLTIDASGLKADVIDDSVTNAKLANMATKTYKGRTSALTGVPEDVAVATLKSDLSLDNVDNTSDVDKPISDLTQTALNAKQDTLVSATNIKTINSTSILGAGDLVLPGTGDVVAPATNTADYIPQWNGANSKTLKDGLAVPAGGLAGLTALDLKIDKTQNTITKDPTGFSVQPTINYDPTTQKVTLTGSFVAYYQGVDVSVANPTFVNGWVSTAHTNTADHNYFLSFNGTSFVWTTDAFPGYDQVLIASVYYGTNDKYALRECHGVMPWQTHKELHETIGTYKESGGTIPSASYVLSSTTAADRRPNIDQTLITDEDLTTTLPALTSETYTQYYLTGASIGAYALGATDIIPLLTNNPYYNTFSTNWGQTLMPANSVATVWIYALPVTTSANSQAYRYLFIQPQWITQATNSSAGALTTAVNTESLRLPSELNLGTLTTQAPELVCIGKIILAYTGSNWTIRAVTLLTGNKFSQIGSPSGNYLSTVATDATLTGDGTGTNPLTVVQSYATKALDNLASVAMNAPLQWNNSAATSLDIAPTANTVVGRALTISAGSTLTGGTADMAGGNLTLNSGLGKGTGASSILFQTGTTLTTGSTLQTLSTKMTLLGNGFLGLGTVTPTSVFTVNKTASDTISVENAAFSFGQNAGLGAGLIGQQLLSSPYGFAIQAQNYANSGSFPIILNPSGGNVGIKTLNPRAPFEVTAGVAGTEQIRIGASSDATKYMSLGTTLIQYVAGNGTSTFLSIGTNVGSSPTGDGGAVKIFTGSNVFNTIFDRNGNVGIGTTGPTAYLQIKAGTATAGTAPLKLTSGTVNTTPEAGAIEFDGTDFFFTI